MEKGYKLNISSPVFDNNSRISTGFSFSARSVTMELLCGRGSE
jgi:hypothetical protein